MPASKVKSMLGLFSFTKNFSVPGVANWDVRYELDVLRFVLLLTFLSIKPAFKLTWLACLLSYLIISA
jgi:hypothetical protein